VETAGNVVKVLGTRFDIRHYEDEPYSAVLLSGSIRLSRGKHEVLLKPGEQAQLMEERWVVGKAGASATSWIDGYFLFDNRSLEYIMRELARWYDIEVFFVDSDKQNEYYSFEIERSSSLKQVMNILEKTRTLDVELKGRTVIIR
jgi:transmembrane sensor